MFSNKDTTDPEKTRLLDLGLRWQPSSRRFLKTVCLRWAPTGKLLNLCTASHKVVRLGINPMIQPEPEDLPKDNPKLEIAVLRTVLVDPSSNDSRCLLVVDWKIHYVDMAQESYKTSSIQGLVKESEIKSFNVPTYTPYKDEVMDLIHKQGSFSLDLLESYELNWDPYDTDYASVEVYDEPIHGKRVGYILRATV
ncbi:SAM dependent carboxyl methyltransferase [Tanacetum coccineum]